MPDKKAASKTPKTWGRDPLKNPNSRYHTISWDKERNPMTIAKQKTSPRSGRCDFDGTAAWVPTTSTRGSREAERPLQWKAHTATAAAVTKFSPAATLATSAFPKQRNK